MSWAPQYERREVRRPARDHVARWAFLGGVFGGLIGLGMWLLGFGAALLPLLAGAFGLIALYMALLTQTYVQTYEKEYQPVPAEWREVPVINGNHVRRVIFHDVEISGRKFTWDELRAIAGTMDKLTRDSYTRRDGSGGWSGEEYKSVTDALCMARLLENRGSSRRGDYWWTETGKEWLRQLRRAPHPTDSMSRSASRQ